LVKILAPAQDVQVGVPVLGGYRPFNFDRRAATKDATAPPLAPPQTLESTIKAIKSVGEREPVASEGESDETSGLASEP